MRIDPIQAAQIFRLLQASYELKDGQMTFGGFKNAREYIETLGDEFSDAPKIAAIMKNVEWNALEENEGDEEVWLFAREFPEDYVASLAGLTANRNQYAMAVSALAVQTLRLPTRVEGEQLHELAADDKHAGASVQAIKIEDVETLFLEPIADAQRAALAVIETLAKGYERKTIQHPTQFKGGGVGGTDLEVVQ